MSGGRLLSAWTVADYRFILSYRIVLPSWCFWVRAHQLEFLKLSNLFLIAKFQSDFVQRGVLLRCSGHAICIHSAVSGWILLPGRFQLVHVLAVLGRLLLPRRVLVGLADHGAGRQLHDGRRGHAVVLSAGHVLPECGDRDSDAVSRRLLLRVVGSDGADGSVRGRLLLRADRECWRECEQPDVCDWRSVPAWVLLLAWIVCADGVSGRILLSDGGHEFWLDLHWWLRVFDQVRARVFGFVCWV
jgi:hypothetical protein